MGKLVSAIVLLAIVLLGLAPLSVSAQPSQPATGELTTACHAPPLEPLTPPLEVRFVEGGPTWTARVHACASPEDSSFLRPRMRRPLADRRRGAALLDHRPRDPGRGPQPAHRASGIGGRARARRSARPRRARRCLSPAPPRRRGIRTARHPPCRHLRVLVGRRGRQLWRGPRRLRGPPRSRPRWGPRSRRDGLGGRRRTPLSIRPGATRGLHLPGRAARSGALRGLLLRGDRPAHRRCVPDDVSHDPGSIRAHDAQSCAARARRVLLGRQRRELTLERTRQPRTPGRGRRKLAARYARRGRGATGTLGPPQRSGGWMGMGRLARRTMRVSVASHTRRNEPT
jgi:hypothetical protein